MLTPDYENRYSPSEKLFLEYARALQGRARQVLAALAAALFAAGLFVSLREARWGYGLLCMVGLFACGVLLCMARIRARLLLQNARELGGGALHDTCVAFGEEILVREGASEFSVQYSQIADVRETEHLFILLLDKYDAVIAVKGRFTVGEEAGFIPFLQAQCRKTLKTEE